MLEVERPLEEGTLALRYPKIAIEYAKGMNTYYKSHDPHDLRHRNKIEGYQKLKNDLSLSSNDQLVLVGDLESSGKNLSFNICRFLEFYRGFQNVNDSIQPVMLYFGMQYLFNAISNPVIQFDNRMLNHGIRVSKGRIGGRSLETLIINKHGHFPRTVDTFYIIDFESNIFSLDEGNGIQYAQPVDETSKDKYPKSIRVLEEIEDTLKYSSNPSIPLDNLIHFINAFEYIIHSSSSEINLTNLMLLDYLLLGVACTASRYHPEKWEEMSKMDSDYKFSIDSSQNRIIHEWIPLIITEYLFPIGSHRYLKDTEIISILEKRHKHRRII